MSKKSVNLEAVPIFEDTLDLSKDFNTVVWGFDGNVLSLWIADEYVEDADDSGI